jgi:transcriptional regulator with XRE-family HTH domain
MATVANGTDSLGESVSAVWNATRSTDASELHRIAEVRAQQGVSLRAISRRTGVDIRDLQAEEQPNSNLTLEQLYRWQEALDVPVANLLVDRDQQLSESVQSRAALIKVMKTVVALGEIATSPRVARMTQMLREQLVEMMPELADVGGWPNYGSRRDPDHVGRIAANPIRVESYSVE